MNLNIKTRTAGYNNKILVSDGKFSLGKNDKVNALVLKSVISKETIPSHKVIAHAHKDPNNVLAQITHEEEKIALILCLTGACGTCFSDKTFCTYQITVKSHKP